MISDDWEWVRVCSLRRDMVVFDRREAISVVEERNTLCGIDAVKGERVCCALASSFNFSRFLEENSGLKGSFVSVSNE